MRAYVVIATRNRHEKLMRTLESLSGQLDGGHVYLACNDDSTEAFIRTHADPDRLGFNGTCVHSGENLGSVAGRNLCLRALRFHDGADVIVIATDDVIFQEGAIQQAAREIHEGGGDAMDFMVGFTQTGNRKFHPAGIVACGNEFVNHFPYRQLYYPRYWHFACQELYEAASIMGRFKLSDKAIVHHLNPITGEGEMDRTHAEARMQKERDFARWKKRNSEGMYWGATDGGDSI